MKVFNRVKQYTNLNPPTPAQYVGLLYLRKYKEKYLSETLPIYKSRMETMYKAIREHLPETVVVKPKAGLFMFPNMEPYLRKLGMSDVDFVMKLLRQCHVAAVPGSAFGEGGKNHLRLTFAKESEKAIKEGIRALSQCVS